MSERKVLVLVADDSEDDRLLLARNLQVLSGFELTGTTLNGVETIAWLNASPPYCNREKYPFPDLLLLDYQMPGYSGLEVVQWLHEQTQRPRVVLWSHTPDLIDEPRAYQLGASVVCAKPGGRADLRSVLARVFPDRCFLLSPSSLAFRALGESIKM